MCLVPIQMHLQPYVPCADNGLDVAPQPECCNLFKKTFYETIDPLFFYCSEQLKKNNFEPQGDELSFCAPLVEQEHRKLHQMP